MDVVVLCLKAPNMFWNMFSWGGEGDFGSLPEPPKWSRTQNTHVNMVVENWGGGGGEFVSATCGEPRQCPVK